MTSHPEASASIRLISDPMNSRSCGCTSIPRPHQRSRVSRTLSDPRLTIVEPPRDSPVHRPGATARQSRGRRNLCHVPPGSSRRSRRRLLRPQDISAMCTRSCHPSGSRSIATWRRLRWSHGRRSAKRLRLHPAGVLIRRRALPSTPRCRGRCLFG